MDTPGSYTLPAGPETRADRDRAERSHVESKIRCVVPEPKDRDTVSVLAFVLNAVCGGYYEQKSIDRQTWIRTAVSLAKDMKAVMVPSDRMHHPDAARLVLNFADVCGITAEDVQILQDAMSPRFRFLGRQPAVVP
ncbi:MAG: hypothetical protein M3O22_02250 [Pseudomonadota bacterium]|nr:hypothetical protein [Pseudomonadota bacterium]